MRVAKSEISPPREGSTKQRHFLLSFFFFDQFMSVLKLKAQVLIRSIGNVETGTASKLGKLVGPKPLDLGGVVLNPYHPPRARRACSQGN
jgi:hypothetical protein